MKFLIDAQLPRRLAVRLRQAGFEAIHTLDLPDGNRTSDQVINQLAIKEEYIVVTKDSDFVESFLLRGEPWKLLLISTGNVGNDELETLFLSNIGKVVEGFEIMHFIEIGYSNVIFHG